LFVDAGAAIILILADVVYGCLLLRSLWLIAAEVVIIDEATVAADCLFYKAPSCCC
jgi:hypothetical protein